MQRALITSLFVTALLVGWFAPSLQTGDIAAKAGAAQNVELLETEAKEQRFAAAKRDAWSAGQALLRRSSDGHFYAKVAVNAQDYRFLVDTGASIVALTGDDATAMGLYWDESELRPIGRGASGTVHGVPTMIPRMELDGFEATNVEAAIIPHGLDVSLLGQSFLSRIDTVSISGDTMTLGD
ncbi:MAG: TIGR02281 family clan AA aspartic protease [Sphingomonadaceae bacterium]